MAKYNKQFWIDKLRRGWALSLKDILKSDYSSKLMDFLIAQYSLSKVNPEKLDMVFEPFRTCKWEDVKIVIVTAEPHAFVGSSGYGYGEPYTTGFHSNRLLGFYEAIERAYYTPNQEFNFDFDFSLKSWAEQGILLLNLSLSLRNDEPGSHQKPWNKFSSEVLNQLNENKSGIVFFLIGERPRKLKNFIKDYHYVLEEECPGVLKQKKLDFPEKHFLEIDKIMINLYNEKIKW